MALSPTVEPTLASSPTTEPTKAKEATLEPTKAEDPTIEPTKVEQTKVEGDKTYTVVRGDYLWKIAVSQCGDGFAWSKIAKANNLKNPDIIHAGNVFKFSC